eukprot:COSAG06_NODE_4009_length_4665_cov_14.628673_5_plen_42_part_00
MIVIEVMSLLFREPGLLFHIVSDSIYWFGNEPPINLQWTYE